MKTYEIRASYLVPQSNRGWIDANSEEEAVQKLAEIAQKNGYVAFKAEEVKVANLETTEIIDMDDAVPEDTKFN